MKIANSIRRAAAPILAGALCAGAALAADPPAAGPPVRSGFDVAGMDRTVAAGADFFKYANGAWERRTAIPADRSSTGTIGELDAKSQAEVREILERLARDADSRAGTAYRSFLDRERIEGLGMAPVEPSLARLRALRTAAAAGRQAYWNAAAIEARRGVALPLAFQVEPDDGDPGRYALTIAQAGLGMPDRDYYLSARPQMRTVRAAYRRYLAATLRLAGVPDADKRAARVLQLETRIAAASWTAAASRDAQRTYNPMQLDALGAPELARLLADLGYRSGRVVVRQPDAVRAILKLMQDAPPQTLADQLAVRVLHRYAEVLPDRVGATDFAFHGRVVDGTEAAPPRWRRAIAFVLAAMPDEVSRPYVEAHFSPATKAAAETMVRELVAAFGRRIDGLDWMTPETRARAHRKLAAFHAYVGYPERWHDYGGLVQREGDAFGNAVRAAEFQHAWEAGKTGQPVYTWEWTTTPMTVDAFANYPRVSIVFPAAILQPPFFDPRADPAVNYGGIGASIAHEMTHHFDDQGSRYDEQGRLTPWWSAPDRSAFERRAAVLVDQFGRYQPLPGMHVDGQLTLGENIADLGGLAIAHEAYRSSLGGREAPVLDGLSGEQRFFLGWAQIWRLKYRDADLRRRLLSNSHAPAAQRVWTARNFGAWTGAFDVASGDPLYLPEAQRARIW